MVKSIIVIGSISYNFLSNFHLSEPMKLIKHFSDHIFLIIIKGTPKLTKNNFHMFLHFPQKLITLKIQSGERDEQWCKYIF